MAAMRKGILQGKSTDDHQHLLHSAGPPFSLGLSALVCPGGGQSRLGRADLGMVVQDSGFEPPKP